jgi:hypothetical protein
VDAGRKRARNSPENRFEKPLDKLMGRGKMELPMQKMIH